MTGTPAENASSKLKHEGLLNLKGAKNKSA
jgi:hypothetical protein